MAERRSLLDGNTTPTQENLNVFDDEFAEDFDGVADGFRPSDHDRDAEDEVEDQPVRTVSAHYASGSVSPAISSRRPSHNSTRKVRPYADNPFSSPDDGDERSPSMTFEPDHMAHRSISSASSAQFARTGSPRFGAGPSHPYAMYPQGTLNRMSSVTTESTARVPTREPSIRGGPQHPYTLYPQGVAEDEDDVAPQNPVPVGFGLGQSYHRQLGPDGEDADIIGEDGHAEQLPPYTRYPEDGPEKMPLLVPEAPTALHSRAPVAGTDPTMDLMHNSLRPQAPPQQRPQSMMDQSALNGARAPSVSNIELMDSSSGSGADSLNSQKSWKEKSWKEKKKTKFCGIPLWWYLLVAGVLSFIVAVLGGVIGGFLRNQKNDDDATSSELSLASSSFYDASVIASPTSLAPPTGTFALSLSTPQETQAQCLPQPVQQPAWSCDLGGPPATAFIVETPEGSNKTGAAVFFASEDESVCYGAQGSSLQTNFAPFITVQDSDSPNAGPAFYFQQFYDKLVVLPEDTWDASNLPTTSSSSKKAKRQFPQIDPDFLRSRQVAQAGDKPWFCVWNKTFIEGFVYVQQPVATSYSLSSSLLTPTPSLNTSPPTTSSSHSTSISPAPTQMVTSTYAGQFFTSTWTGPASDYSEFPVRAADREREYEKVYTVDHDDDDHDHDDDNDNSYRRRSKRWGFQEDLLYESMDLYPYVVKLEERRLPGNTVTPYCQQYQILNNGGYGWVEADDGGPIVFELEEEDPSYANYDSRMVPGGCHCQWISGQSSGNSEVS
ncbi:hypothetical protein D0865_08060 [Hortaea werneckii]|uniref:DUF7820 domain-containing protein n=1 Tax=Hortaea werneckii TaxID=91943 RepID=A0A3M7C905_HORWE|nr:hypothetical protein D0865_08060 [Hortaea werneckii]